MLARLDPPLHVTMPWTLLKSPGPERMKRLLRIVEGQRVARIMLGPRCYWLINDAELARHVLQENAKVYRKSRSYEFLKPFLGDGLFTSEGEAWKRQRKLAQPAFHQRALAKMTDGMVAETRAMLERWADLARRGERFDAAAEMMRLTLAVVGRTLFSADLNESANDLGRALTTVLKLTERRVFSLVPLADRLPTPSNVRYARALAELDHLVGRIIQDRRRGTPQEDLLGVFMAARDEETGETMTDTQLRDEVMTLVLAGHETTANTLSFAWALLSKYPDVARRTYREVKDVLGGREPTMADVKALSFTGAVIQEVLRKCPAVWMIERQTLEPDRLAGHELPPGTIVTISPYLLHHHRDYWTNPEGFDPERFLEPAPDRPKFAYLPFGGGPRVCIGNGFALAEATIVTAMVAQRYFLDVDPGYHLEPELMLVMRPKGGVPVRLRSANV